MANCYNNNNLTHIIGTAFGILMGSGYTKNQKISVRQNRLRTCKPEKLLFKNGTKRIFRRIYWLIDRLASTYDFEYLMTF